jgi:hypothetical protein
MARYRNRLGLWYDAPFLLFLSAGGRVPILVRPVREQLEHDRVIRFLQSKLKRRYEVTTNIGEEQNAGVRSGSLTLYPDLVLNATGRGRRIEGVIEVETNESVNHLEAMAQWANFGRSRVPFSLYVPAGSVDMARRLCTDHQVSVGEIWSYHAIGDQMRFTLVHRAPQSQASAKRPAAERPARTAATRVTARRAGSGPATRRKAAAARGAKPAARKTAGRAQKRK